MQKIAITQGECGSINYELLVRVFLDSAFLETLRPVLFGSSKILSMVAKSMGQTYDGAYFPNVSVRMA